MAKITEKRLYKVPAQAFTTNGTQNGELTVADSSVFVVGHLVVITSNTQPPLKLKIKRIPNSFTVHLGEEKQPIQNRTDISAYLVTDGATIFAEEQNRPTIPEQEIERNTYDEEPIVARRVSLIDIHGDHISDLNPLPVEATLSPSLIGTPNIYNVVAPNTGTEYSQLLPNDTAQFLVRARNGAKLQIAYTLGASLTNFLTILPGNIYKVEGVRLTNKTIYFTSSKNDTIVEIVAWT